MRKHVLSAAAAAVLLSGLAAPAAAAPSGDAEPPANGRSFREQVLRHRPTGRLQVRFKDGVGADRRAAALSRVTARGLSVRVDRRIPGLNAAVISVSNARAVQALLRASDDVLYVEPESRYKALQSEPAPSAEIKEIGADQVHSATTPNLGVGTSIAVLDSPVDTANADLDNGKVVFSGEYTTDVPPVDGDPFNTQDHACTAAACPHGTAVAAAAAASAGDGNLTGVAPGASIRSYNVFRRFVYTDPSNPTQTFEVVGASSGDIAAAINAVATHAAGDPSIVAMNMSLGGPFDNQLVKDAIANLHAAAPRVTVVVAAGNDGAERANFPAGDPYVLSVGATGQVPGDDCDVAIDPATPWTLASFSNRGDVDVVAPGHCVNLWYPPTDEDTGAVSGPATLTKGSGTSFAAPMVAGVAALLASSSKPVFGDAARAAIIAGATPRVPAHVGYGNGRVSAPASIALAAGTGVFTSVSLDRGAQVASAVGKRTYEVIRVDPSGATSPVAPVPSVTTGYGTVTAGAATSGTGLGVRRGTFSAAAKSGSFTMTATDSVTSTVPALPMKMLDSGNNFEGLPMATGEASSVPLTYGSRSAYIRSVKLADAQVLTYSYTFDPHGWGQNGTADLFAWEPASDGATADAAMEPTGGHWDPETMSDTWTLEPGADWCAAPGSRPDHTCNRGRWLFGWVTFSPVDNSVGTSRYKLSMSYPGPTALVKAPALASTGSVTGPFTVTWGGNTKATKFDVSYAVKTKSGSTWSVSAWKPWKSKTTAKSAVFGSGGAPETVVPGRTYHFRVQAWDSLDNPSLAKTGYTAAPYDDRSGSIAYSTGSTAWTRVSGLSDRWLKTATKTSAANARASLTAETSSFTIVGDKCTTCGQFKVYLDGVYKATVDTYYTSTAVRRPLWTSGALSGGIKSRRLTIIVVGTRNRPKVVLDGISILR